MLFWFPPRRLALLAAVTFIVIIFTLHKTSYEEYLPATHHASGTYWSHHGMTRTHANIGTLGTLDTALLRETRPSSLPHWTNEQIQSKISELRVLWSPPSFENHWPPYNHYNEADYDPNLWESFRWDHDFYIRNGIKRLNKEKPYAAKLVPYLPYPEYNSVDWKREWRGSYVPCDGPRGRTLDKSADDWLMAYSATPDGFPQPAVGDADVLGLDLNHCFDRYHRLGPYGYGQNRKVRVNDWNKPRGTPNWAEVPWGRLQDQCLRANEDRYKVNARNPVNIRHHITVPNATVAVSHNDDPAENPKHHHRTALLIRAWSGYHYTENDLQSIRSLITELSLFSGGEYQVFLLVNIKNKTLDLDDTETRQTLLEQYVPHEFHGISILWNEKILESWYPHVGDWQVYWHQFMPLQWFSKSYPQFDFVWNWEVDVRYTGNQYHFLEQVTAFSKAMPRKHLWERNQRFYFPDVHGSYQKWLADTDASIEASVESGSITTVWGPQPYNGTSQTPVGPRPPHSEEQDNFEWGAGEEADLITLQPIWDPTCTDWSFRDKIFNFLPGIRPQFSDQDPLDRFFTHPEFVNIPRRTYINTVSRFSKRQLHAMHTENSVGRTMQAEMWPATVALHHGLKAVYAPHPIWTDRKWPGWYMDAIFNSDGAESAKWSAGEASVYNHDREHNFAGWSWYYNSDFPRVLYRRWLGWPASVGPEKQYPNNPLRAFGGYEFEERGIEVQVPENSTTDWGAMVGKDRQVKVGGQGRMCLPPMLLHPVKKTSEPEGYLRSLDLNVGDEDVWSRAWKWLNERFDAA